MISKKLCLESTTASMIWPFAKTLIRLLEQMKQDSGLQSMKATLVGSVKKRFEKYNSRSCIAVATLIDPRYKAAFFTNEQIASHKAEMLRLLEDVHDNQEAEKASPPRKLRKTEESLWDCMEDIACSSGPSSDTVPGHATELDSYLLTPRISMDASPLNWWREKNPNFRDWLVLHGSCLPAQPRVWQASDCSASQVGSSMTREIVCRTSMRNI